MSVIKKTKTLTIAQMVDHLGRVKADIAALEKEEKGLVATIKALGVGQREGTFFNSVVTIRSSYNTNWEAIAAEAKVPQDIIRSHSQTVTVTTTNWMAAVQEAAVDEKTINKHTESKDVLVCTVTARR